jgi:hypothetical protein
VGVLPAAPVSGADAPRISLEAKWLLLRKEDVSDQMVQHPDRVSQDGPAQLTERRWDPRWRGAEDHPPVPTLTINKLWIADDVAAAQTIFREQVDAGFDEAGSVQSVGGFEVPGWGDEAHGIGGCTSECATNHTRIVFRYINVVHALYVGGPREFAYRDVAVNWANILDERVRAVPSGPAPDLLYRDIHPRQIALGVGELGGTAFLDGEGEGSDDKGQWYWARVKRDITEAIEARTPAEIYSKVWVAKDIDAARDIFRAEAKPGLPEAREKVGNNFNMSQYDFTPGVGNENWGWQGCNESCNTEFFNRLHERYVLRIGNVAMVIYIWGERSHASINQVAYYAETMKKRLPAGS